MKRCLMLLFLLVPFAVAQHDHASMDHGQAAPQAQSEEGMDHAVGDDPVRPEKSGMNRVASFPHGMVHPFPQNAAECEQRIYNRQH
jgi:hypothetical protein